MPLKPEMEPNPNQSAWDHNSRLGLVLFFIYLALYGGFILLCAFALKLMGKPTLGGMNLAIVYGFALIVGAFALALVYMILCQSEPDARPELTDAEASLKAVEEEGQA